MLRVVGGIGSCCPCLLLPPLWNDGSGRLSSWCCADDIVIWVQTEVQTALSFMSLYLNDVIMQEVMSQSQLLPMHALSLAATFVCAGSLLILLTQDSLPAWGSHCSNRSTELVPMPLPWAPRQTFPKAPPQNTRTVPSPPSGNPGEPPKPTS